MTEKEILRDLIRKVQGVLATSPAIIDTVWLNDHTTLWDQIDIILADTEDTGGEKFLISELSDILDEANEKYCGPEGDFGSYLESCFLPILKSHGFTISRQPPKEPEEKIEIGGDGVIAPENNHPVFRDYLYHVKPRDRTLSDAFNAGLRAKPVEQDDGVTEAADLVYIQDTRSFMGDSAVWWRHGGSGYTYALKEAGVYTRKKAEKTTSRETDIFWPKGYIDSIAILSADVEIMNEKAACKWTGENQ